MINRALTGPDAKRRNVEPSLVKQAWEALEEASNDFEGLRNFSAGQCASPEEMVRYVTFISQLTTLTSQICRWLGEPALHTSLDLS
jgi:hypothetical protein